MPQPPAYTRQFDFSDYQSTNPTDPLPGTNLDLEFDEVKETLDAILANLELIQRDDGEIANLSVGQEQLTSGVTIGFNTRGDWVTATAYEIADVVWESNILYRCVEEHTSGTFATDLAAEKWIETLDIATLTEAAEAAQTAAETAQTAAELAETNAETAETAAELAETNAETAETAAELAETNAAASAVDAAASAAAAGSYDMPFNAGYTAAFEAQDLVVQTYGKMVASRAGSFTGQSGYIETVGTGAAVIVDILKNGTTIYTTKPQFEISTNALTAGTLKTDGTEDFVAGDRISFAVTQVGSTIKGARALFTAKAQVT